MQLTRLFQLQNFIKTLMLHHGRFHRHKFFTTAGVNSNGINNQYQNDTGLKFRGIAMIYYQPVAGY